LFTEEVNYAAPVEIEIWDVSSGQLVKKSNIAPYDPRLVSLTAQDGFVTSEPLKIWGSRSDSLKVEFSHPIGWCAYRGSKFDPPDAHLPKLKERREKLAAANDLFDFARIVRGEPGSTDDDAELNVYSCLSSDTRTAATSVYETGIVQLWDTATGRKIISIALPEHMQSVERLTFSRDGRFVAAYSQSFPTFIFNAQTGAYMSQLPVQGHDTYNRVCQFTEDGRRIVVKDAISGKDSAGILGSFRTGIYDTINGGCVKECCLRDDLTLSGDGHRAIVISKGKMTLSDFDDDTVLLTLAVNAEPWISSMSDTLVVGGSEESLSIWRRRRPERWWGVFWLPEFWLTLIFSCALLWSLRRDWKQT